MWTGVGGYGLASSFPPGHSSECDHSNSSLVTYSFFLFEIREPRLRGDMIQSQQENQNQTNRADSSLHPTRAPPCQTVPSLALFDVGGVRQVQL